MKILRIQFQNLNSLADGEIDLESGPLAQAGIFAITGPTGAGKSTILDALTLALYGRAARYGSTPNPPDMMSRHTGRYTARWELRRARGRSGGNVQPARRSILDRHGSPVAEKLAEADRLIEELTGLDYHRFLRSVLLAQGDFAQFLKADKDARAELLESLTGTQIYSDLGTLAHDECTRREAELARAEGDLGRIILFTGEERASKLAGLERLAAGLDTAVRERDALANRIQMGRQLAGFLRSEAELFQREEALTAERAAAADELEKLARHRLAQPFFGDLRTLDDLAHRVLLEGTRYDDARSQSAAARRRLASALHAASGLAATLVAEADRGASESRRRSAELARDLAASDEWLTIHAGDRELDAAFAGLVAQLTGLAGARDSHSGVVKEERKLSGERAKVFTRIAERETAHAEATESARNTGNAASAAAAALGELLQGKTLDMILQDAMRLEHRQDALENLRNAEKNRDVAARRSESLASEESGCATRLEAARIAKDRLQAEWVVLNERFEFSREKVDLLKRIAKLEDHRALLKSGDPCPLCGSLEHPFAAPGAEPSSGIREAEKTLTHAKTAAVAAAKASEQSAEALARIEQTLLETRKRLAEAKQEQALAADRFSELAGSLQLFTAEALAGAIDDCSKARAATNALSASVRSAEQRRAEADLAHARQQAAVVAQREKLEAARTEVAALDRRLSEHAAAIAESAQKIDALTHQLDAALQPFAVAVPEPGAESRTRKMLEERRKAWIAQSTERGRLEAELGRATVQIADWERRVAEARNRAAKLVESTQSADLANVAVERDESARFRSQWKTFDDAEGALDPLRSALTGALAAEEERRKERDAVEKAARLHTEDLNRRLALASEAPFADVGALRAARLADKQASRIERLESEAEKQAAALAAQVDQVRRQIAPLQEAGAPVSGELAALESDRLTREGEVTAITEQRTTLRNELSRDDENRLAKETRSKDLEEERKSLAVWEQLRRLIGSHDGSKFRQFAQGLSLDVLVRHANRHLRRLSDRYQLRRVATGELQLEILDLHQASAIRPMLSLSGGESFLASLALALGLSDLAGRNVRIDSLFIDEGFGSLDSTTLDIAISALDTLRLSNKTVGVISHVELLKERIPVQIRVEKLAGGASVLRLPEG